jgi:hypothetical protein
MKISNIISLFVIIILLFLAGCEKQVHRMNVDPVKKRLVLNGSMGPDMPFEIHISSSMQPVGPELVNLVEDAVITITDEHNNTIYAKHDSMGFYYADWYPEENRKYRIVVKAPTFEDASVTVTIPEPVTNTSFSKSLTELTYPYSLTFKDPPEEKNTYMIRSWYPYKEIRHLWYESGGWKDDTLTGRRTPVMYSSDQLIGYYADGIHIGDEAPTAGERASSGFLISDELFNGREHTIRFKATYINKMDVDRPYLFVDLVSAEKGFYDFVKSYTLYFTALQTPFAEPVAILSNIENGLGYFYGYSVHTDSILYR